MRTRFLIVAGVLAVSAACAGGPRGASPDPSAKVEIDLAQIDDDGRCGPPDGKVAVSYEFCIPDTERHKAEVRAIDRSVQLMPGSRGRIGAGPGECLCIGTAGKDWRDVLRRLSELPYVKRVIRCHFE